MNERYCNQNYPPSSSGVHSCLSQSDYLNSASICPYGVKFGEEDKVRKLDQQRYKEDLDYLCSLKKRKKEIEDYSTQSRLIQYMNEKYNHDKLNNQVIFKQLDEYNYQTALNNQRQQSEKKRAAFNEYIETQNMKKRQEEIQKELMSRRKARLMNDIEENYEHVQNKKHQKAQEKMQEAKENEVLWNEENYRFHSPSLQYRNKINEMNRKIYDRSKLYNGYFNSPLDNEFFNAKNDFEFNKKIAERNEREKYLMRIDQTKVNQRKEEARRIKEEDIHFMDMKRKSQSNYKTYLDSQSTEKTQKTMEERDKAITGRQLLLPSYNYPNFPVPLTKKAFDPLHVDHASTPDLTVNKTKYLGESSLRHNPITCPINDIEYNKYVFKHMLNLNKSSSSSNSLNSSQNGRNDNDKGNCSILSDAGNRIISVNSQ